jgi:hypothetical protein
MSKPKLVTQKPQQVAQADDPVQTERRVITPAQALEWLSQKAPNRTLSKPLVGRMARDMSAGRWKITHQGIAFGGDGRLIDGQHRLAAIVAADVPVEMLVTVGLNEGTQVLIDDHRRRALHDILRMQMGEAVSTLDTAVLRLVLSAPGAPDYVKTKAELVPEWPRYVEAVQFATRAHTGPAAGIRVAPVLAPVARAYLTHEHARLACFLRVVMTGIPEQVPDDTAALKLHNWLLNNRAAKRKASTESLYFMSQTALRHFLDRRDIRQLRETRDDLFPVPKAVNS